MKIWIQEQNPFAKGTNTGCSNQHTAEDSSVMCSQGAYNLHVLVNELMQALTDTSLLETQSLLHSSFQAHLSSHPYPNVLVA